MLVIDAGRPVPLEPYSLARSLFGLVSYLILVLSLRESDKLANLLVVTFYFIYPVQRFLKIFYHLPRK